VNDVAGFGLDDRTLPLDLGLGVQPAAPDHAVAGERIGIECGHHAAAVLHLPAAAVRDNPLTPQQLADLVWETMHFVQEWRYLAARSYIDETVRPALSPIADSHRPHLVQITDDLASQLSPFA
jgi:hypothetical protein